MQHQKKNEDRALSKLRGELGCIVRAGLDDNQVIEVLLNADGKLWFDRLGEGMSPAGEMSSVNAMALIGTMADSLNTTVTRTKPVLEGELAIDGSRIEALIPPLVASPIFAIRKRASNVFSLGTYVDSGALTEEGCAQIEEALTNRKNIVIAGGTGSGKTTLVNAAIDWIVRSTPQDRIVLLEDTVEIQCAAKNFVQMRTSAEVSMTQLLRATMRLRPDRILVGEVRGPEALALLKAWNTGHPGGVATVHANSAVDAVARIASLVGEAGVAREEALDLIHSAVDLIVFIERTHSGRRISEIHEVQ